MADVLMEAEAVLAGDGPPNSFAANGTALVEQPERSQNHRRVKVAPMAREHQKAEESIDAILKQHTVGGGAHRDSGGMPDPTTLRRDVFELQSRLHKMNRGLLNPTGKLMQYWDFFTLSALFYTATVTPYEVCLLWEEPKFYNPIHTWLTPLFVVNWIVNLVFVVDICFNFFLPYRESVKKGGSVVKNHRSIACHYLQGWFGLDIISVIPVDNAMMFIDTTGVSNSAIFSSIRMLRLLRLIKLARILRASRIFSRWENSISLSYARQDLIRWTLVVLVLLHWLACILGILAQLTSPPRSDQLAMSVERAIQDGDEQCYGCLPDGARTPGSLCSSPCLTTCEIWQLAQLQLPGGYNDEISARVARLSSEQSWVCRYSEAGKVSPPTWHAEVWVAALYVALIQLGGGVGSIVPENFSEYIVFLVGIIIGSVTWAMVVGTICATMATGDPYTNAFRASMDSLNYFLEDMQMPQGLRIRAREYLRNTRDLFKKSSYNELISSLSPDLRADIVLHMSAKTLELVWYLGSLEQPARVELATKLGRAGYAPREKISSMKLNILMRGVAAKAGNILTPSMYWGDDVIVTSLALRDLRPASALTYVEVTTVAREDLDAVLADFPKSAAIVRQAAMRIAMKRAVVIISEFVKTRQDLRKSAGLRTRNSAALSLASAFGHTNDPAAEDPALILRIITGANLKDIVDGELVEEVDDAAESDDGKAMLNMLRRGREERVTMRREIAAVQSDVAAIKDMMATLLAHQKEKGR